MMCISESCTSNKVYKRITARETEEAWQLEFVYKYTQLLQLLFVWFVVIWFIDHANKTVNVMINL